jgi:ABC-type uncharacterized transport system substrate-binding protein
MRRRDLLVLAGAAAAAPLVAHAQQKKMPVIGFLNGVAHGVNPSFIEGLRETGFVDGQNVRIEFRGAAGHFGQLPALAADLVARKVDLIATGGGDVAASAAKQATSTIPIVSQMGGDPVAEGLIASLARPGGNLTGISMRTVALMPKRLELLSELVPQAKVIGLLVDPDAPGSGRIVREEQAAAHATGVRLEIIKAGTDSDIDAAFATQLHADALLVGSNPFFASRFRLLVALASRYRIPAMYEWGYFVKAGGLISYEASVADVYRRLGIDAGRILKGEKPADLPAEQSAKVELMINLKTAKTLGITVPQLLLARADEVIE